MSISVLCRFHDDEVQIVDDQYLDFREAVAAALYLADLHGNDRGDGHGPPKCFEVWVAGKIKLSIAVIRGGLAPRSVPRSIYRPAAG